MQVGMGNGLDPAVGRGVDVGGAWELAQGEVVLGLDEVVDTRGRDAGAGDHTTPGHRVVGR